MTDIAERVREVIRRDMTESARTQQSVARLIGPSEVGGCRAYLAHMIADTPYDEGYDDDKWAAYIGTYVGAAIETGLTRYFPDRYATQVPLTATFPSGLQVSGHCDVVEHGVGIDDLKSKDGLAMIRHSGPSLQHLIQVNIYLLAAIQEGLVPEDGTWSLVYVDRSGRESEPYVVTGTLDMDIILVAESRLEDALYAAEHNMNDAPRDEPMDFCLNYCPFVGSCRGKDEHQTGGLIQATETLEAIAAYQAGLRMKNEGKKLQDEAKAKLIGIEGSTGEVEVTWTTVDATKIEAYERAAYTRMTIKRIPKKKVTA